MDKKHIIKSFDDDPSHIETLIMEIGNSVVKHCQEYCVEVR